MRVNDLRPERVDRPKADVRADARERREPLRVIGPVNPVGAKVRIAGPVVEMGASIANRSRPAALPLRIRAGPPNRSS